MCIRDRAHRQRQRAACTEPVRVPAATQGVSLGGHHMMVPSTSTRTVSKVSGLGMSVLHPFMYPIGVNGWAGQPASWPTSSATAISCCDMSVTIATYGLKQKSMRGICASSMTASSVT
eukprot:2979392-Prymnesium_polylepis.1